MSEHRKPSLVETRTHALGALPSYDEADAEIRRQINNARSAGTVASDARWNALSEAERCERMLTKSIDEPLAQIVLPQVFESPEGTE